MNDGYEGKSLILQSVTEQSSMDDFLLTAELAGRDFTAEKENIQLVTPQLNSGILSAEKLKKVKATQDLYKDLLRIPRRPLWNESTQADKLRQDEQFAFLEWRRQLGRLQEEQHILLTPYEKNLEFWRQLWRVIERSDVVVQIVDARNPLLFWCPDVDKYVKEVDPKKQTLLLINKADLLTDRQRQAWAEYFAAQSVHVVFWSAVEESGRIEREKNNPTDGEDNPEDTKNNGGDMPDNGSEEEDEDNCDTAVKDTVKTDDRNENERDSDNEDDNDIVNVDKPEICDDNESSEKEDASDVKDSVPYNEKDRREPNDDTNSERNVVKDNVPSDETHRAESSDNKDANGSTCDEDDDEACSDEDNDSDDYDTIEEDTDDEGEIDLANNTSESRAVMKQEDDVLTKTQYGVTGSDSPATSSGLPHQKDETDCAQAVVVTASRLQTSEDLLALFRRTARVNHLAGVTTVGMVGYPNVGKSSTINAILQTKKVPVSATPGRTKHFQTVYVERDLMLCDCPGLVFPSFVNSKAELVVNGILPIDQLQDSEPPVELVCHRVGRSAFEALYHMNLPPPEAWEDPDKAPSAYDLLHTYGALRGFMSHKGNPDRPRAARYILKDFVSGRLLFCHPPPGIEAKVFQKPPYGAPKVCGTAPKPSSQKTASEQRAEALDRDFFTQMNMKAHAKGPHAVGNYVRTEGLRQIGAGQGQGSASEASSPHSSQSSLVGKPWKRHNNRNKKEKLRRVYKDLDRY